jgi:hypothetical protein
MSDKSHTQGHNVKKPAGKSIKEKRAEKRAKHEAATRHDLIADAKKR